MKVPLLDLKPQYAALRDDIDAALAEVIDSQRFIMGPQVSAFEEAVADFCGVEYGVSCASGTDALLLPLMALELQPGDEVITTPFTFFATAGTVVNAGGTPVFVDIDPGTLNIDPDRIRAAVTDRTRAIIAVHLFGQMAPMPELLAIAEEVGVPLIEDAAQAISARQQIDGAWQQAGSLGTVGTFSFFPSKNLGAWGDGGMIVTGDADLAHRLRLLRTHGGAKQYHHDIVGTNSRLDTLQAAVLSAKLPHLNGWSAARRANAFRYNEAFASVPEVRTLDVLPENEPVFHQYTIRVERRDELQAHLKAQGIGNAVYYPVPLHRQPCFADLGYAEGSLPVAESACRDVISLPVYPELPPEAHATVVSTITGFYA